MDQQDNYLHKKFKKQLSIEPRTNQAQCNNINNNNNNSVSNNNNAKDVGLLQQQDEDGFGGGGGGCSGGVPTTKSTNSLTVLSYVKKSSISSPPLPSSSSFSSNSSSSSSSSSSLSSPPSSTTICTNGVENANNNVVNVDQIDVDDRNHPQDISLKSLSLQESSAAAVTSSTAVAATNSTTSASSSGGKYVCTYCNLACSKPSVLQKHIRAHTNERPYPCVSCGFSFKTRSNLYKHCRSRTHANRLLGNYGTRPSSGTAGGANQERDSSPPTITASTNDSVSPERNQFKEDTLVEQQQQQHHQQPQKQQQQQQFNQMKSKPYKPRFHTRDNGENVENEVTMPAANSEMIMHINEIIDKNNSIVNSEFARRRPSDEDVLSAAEPLNLTKSRKRCLSEVSEPSTQKSLIKELLLKNLYADTNMRCPHCKMIFQTVTELELHKMRNCKGIIKSGPRYSRSSSVNVASILTQNKNAFDNIPAVFPLKSPGPFLGKTRLVESDKSKSFSFEEGIETIRYSSFSYDSRTKRPPVKMFGGEVKITQTSGETKSFKIDGKEHGEDGDYPDYKMSENRVVKSTLQSGGTVMQSKVVVGGYVKQQQQQHQQQETTSVRIDSPAECVTTVEHHHRHQRTDKDPPDRIIVRDLSNGTTKYPNILDFSQNAVKLLAPNLRQLNLSIPLSSSSSPSRSIVTSTTPMPNHHLTICESPQTTTITSTPLGLRKEVVASTPHHQQQHQNGNILNPLNLLVNGKVVRYVPGMPGPVVAEPPIKLEKPAPPPPPIITITTDTLPPSPSQQKISPLLKLQPSSSSTPEKKKFARPNSLALKPSMSSLKQHHGLTPTMFNQILISPDTPRGAKKYNEHFLHGNYFSYLGLKSSTKPVYCTLNKTQPFYVPHFKKLSMYSEWRQQDNKADKMYSAAYDSRQRNQKYTTAGKDIADYIVHSSYKFSVSENSGDDKEDEYGKSNSIFGGYESNEDYTYIRGRGRGRYVCDQCGIRCKKPSMLKKHIRTHSNDRPYTCRHCNFSFKTKGNLTKHMKSKAHTKNYAANSSSPSTAAALHAGYQPSSDSDTDDSGMDSSDESSTRQEEHEAAYGLLSLSQKSPNSSSPSQSNHHHNYNNHSDHFMNADQLVHVSKINYAKNVIMNQQRSNLGTLGIINSTVTVTATANICSTTATSATSSNTHPLSSAGSCEGTEYTQYLGKSNPNRPLTYPYNTASSSVGMPMSIEPPVLPPIPPLSDDSPQRLEVVEEESRRSPEKQPKNIINFNVIKRYSPQQSASPIFRAGGQSLMLQDEEMVDEKDRKRKLEPPSPQTVAAFKLHKNIKDGEVENEEVLVIDLSRRQNGVFPSSNLQTKERPPRTPTPPTPTHHHQHHHQQQLPLQLVGNQHILQQQQQALPVFRNNGLLMEHRVNYYYQDRPPVINAAQVENAVSVATRKMYYDNSAMETLADVATKQEKLEKNSMAKNVASEFLKLATQNEQNANGGGPSTATSLGGAVGSPCGSAVASCSSNAGGGSGGSVGNSDDKAFLANSDLVKSSEENKSCTICSKNFSKPSQLRLHMNIHYLERPFRCETCSVSFRTKGHLQKHERSAMHCNKLSSSPATSSSEPRPFKCADCNIAFRIHGHLAKHLRSKMHIMKLECLAKIPFGLYAELERSNSLLTEINTADGDQCLDSLKLLAKRVFLNDPSKQSHFEDDKSEGMETTDTES